MSVISAFHSPMIRDTKKCGFMTLIFLHIESVPLPGRLCVQFPGD